MRLLRGLMLALDAAHGVAGRSRCSRTRFSPIRRSKCRARVLSKELRCMVCQNQSIDDSDAPLARDLRLLVRERLKEGDSDKQVIDYLVTRYGEFVLLNPRLSLHTALLWFGPPIALGGGALALFWRHGGAIAAASAILQSRKAACSRRPRRRASPSS